MCSSYMHVASPPPNLPARLRRKSSSSSINAPSLFNTDDDDLDSLLPSSPLLSSSPLPTPICSSPTRFTTGYSHSCKFESSSYEDGAPGSLTSLYRRGSSPEHFFHQHVTTVFDKHNSLSRFSLPSPVHHVPEDDGCDLESMDIHLHETFFATSSERGRWKSSPIIPRTYGAKKPPSSPICPRRGHSTLVKVKSVQNMKSSLFEFREFSRRQSSEVVEEPLRSPFLSFGDYNDPEDHRISSPLPPSSPPTSLMSFAASQPDDCTSICDDMNLDVGYGSDDFNFDQEDTFFVHSDNILPCDVPISGQVGPLISEHVLNATSAACSSSCKKGATCLPLNLSTTVPISTSRITITPTSPVAIEVPRPRSHSPANASSQFTNIPPPLSKEMGNLERLPEKRTVDVASPVKTVKKPRLSFSSENDFVQGSSAVRPQPQVARRSSISRPTSPAKDVSGAKESAKIQPERKLNTRLKREDSVASVAPAQKKLRLSEDADLQIESDTCRKPRQRKQKTASERRSCSPKASSEDFGGQITPNCEGSQPSPTPDLSSRKPKPQRIQSEPEIPDAEQVELTGMLIEALATSRASSMDPFALYGALMQTHPHLETKYNKKEWLKLIPVVLEAGRTRCGMFEKVHSSGANGAKQARWFYLSENDEDRERARLLEELMPKQKRSETKKFKKYYYKPLNKISRWDPEDAI